MQGPRLTKPSVPSKNVDLMKLKAPGAGAAAPQMPLMPNQVVFRHKAWLPWWVALLLPLLILLALLLFLLLPRNVVVPEVTGAKSAFEAEEKLTEASLKLAPAPKQKVSTEAPPGTVIGQTPEAGEKAKKDSEVAILIAVGNGKVEVPNVVGQTQADAEKTLREAGLTVGQVQPQPPDPKAKISSQIPAEKEVVAEGKPIDIFLASIKDKKKKDGEDGEGGGGGGGGGAAAATLPALVGTPVAEAAQKAADAGLVPVKVSEFSEKKKGDLIRTEPEGGTKLKAGDKVTLVVSAGFPQMAYDNGENVLLVNGANGKRLPAIAKGSQKQTDPAWSHDGTKVAFVGNERVFLADREKPDEPAVGLTATDERFGDLAWAPTVDLNLLAMFKDKSPKGQNDANQDLCLMQITKDPSAPQCTHRGLQRGQDAALGARRQDDLRARHQARQHLRHGPLDVEEGVLAGHQGLEQGQVLHRHLDSRQGRARLVDLARRQAAGRGRELRRRGRRWQQRLPALPRQAERLRALGGQAAGRARVQGRVALGRQGARDGAAGRALRREQRPARPRARVEAGSAQKLLVGVGDNPAFQPLTLE